MLRKFVSVPVINDPALALGERQIMVVASDPTLDRTKDVMKPDGILLDNYRENNVVLASHDPKSPIGNATVTVKNNRVEALIDFAPAGATKMADEWCALAKAGVIRAVSVGFDPIDYEPNEAGGYDFNKWELMEISLVAVPANPGARIIARAHDPEGETKEHRPLGAKGMYGLACLASILDDLGYLQSMTAFEAEMEGDGSNLPAMLGEAMRALANALIAMSREEAAELLAGAGAVPDEVAVSFTASQPLSFVKIFAELRAKAGRALSASNTAHVAEIGKALDAIAGHHAAAIEHVKALSEAGKKPPDEESEPDDDANEELSFAAAQRKRLAAVAAIRRVS